MAGPLGPNTDTSKTHKLYLTLRHSIVTGSLPGGAKFPSEPDLGSLHGVSRVTVRRALDHLEQEGLVRRQPGAGTFVANRPETTPFVADLANALASIGEMGRTTEVRLLSFAFVSASNAIGQALLMSEGETCQRSVRVRLIDGEPFSYLVTHVPSSIGETYSEEELASTPLLFLLERSGVQAQRAHQTVSATIAAPEVAHALNTDIGSPLISLTRVVFDRDGRGVEHLHALYRPDRYSLKMDLVRSGKAEKRHWTPKRQSPA
ncbi:GntR family transcriptional regulator [Microvirga antarctica]|uniref:GntR family transcriptional regulator n=1 Tax=Microvirga antarctica TaxID=2819233 RepID=UPI001B30DA05|nr:GntR family transcriptional regulator [Microvirga antarctica]